MRPRRKIRGAWRALRLAAIAPLMLIGACASTPPHYPAQTAQTFIGKPLFDLEMRWSIPIGLRPTHYGRLATWRFNQYNFDGCNVLVHIDHRDIIRKVTWTTGCGPKPTQKKSHPAAGRTVPPKG